MTNTRTTRTGTYFGAMMAMAALLASIIVAMSALSVPAVGKQSGDLTKDAPVSKKDAAVATTSSTTPPKATFASGSGANFLGVKVSDHGNLMSFEFPQGRSQVFGGQEGYAVCSNFGQTVHGHDTGSVESGFGPPTFAQPNAGAFPLTVTRTTTDGKLKLKQVWNKPDPVEADVTVSMTLTNISGAQINTVSLSRSGDFDIGTSSADQGARTIDSAWQWDDRNRSDDFSQAGVMLSALSFGTDHGADIESRSDWNGGTREKCLIGSGQTTPTPVQDLAMRVVYGLGDLGAGQSKTVKFEYGRM